MTNSTLAFSDVAKVSPSVVQATCLGETFTLKAFGVRKLQRALPHIAVIGLLLQALEADSGSDPALMIGLVANGGDSLLELIGLAIDRPSEWLDDADPFEVAALALAVAQVNLDFFGNARTKLGPLKEQATALMAQLKR